MIKKGGSIYTDRFGFMKYLYMQRGECSPPNDRHTHTSMHTHRHTAVGRQDGRSGQNEGIREITGTQWGQDTRESDMI